MRRRATEMPDTRSGIAPSTKRLCRFHVVPLWYTSNQQRRKY